MKRKTTDEPRDSAPIASAVEVQPDAEDFESSGVRENRQTIFAGRPRPQRDLAIALILLCSASFWGTVYYHVWGLGQSVFYQELYGPAVMVALGKGYASPDLAAVPEIGKFLNNHRTVDRLAIESLPEKIPWSRPNYWEQSSRYLVTMVGVTWWIFGIQWSNLAILFGLFFGTTSTILYFLFRFGMGRILAVSATAIMIFSPLHLLILPFLRDYSKAPFILGALLILGICIRRRFRPWPLLLLAALLGVVLGIGRGCRLDLLIVIPAAAVVFLCFVPGPWRRTLPARIAAVLVMVGAFQLCSMPLALNQSERNASFLHEVTGGLSPAYDTLLGVDGAPYEKVYVHSDVQTYLDSYAYARRTDEIIAHPKSGELHSDTYQAANTAYFLALVRQFPADILLRPWMAVARILRDVPYVQHTHYGRFFSDRGINRCLERLYNLRWTFFGWLWYVSYGFVALSMVFLAARDLRVAFAATFLMLYFAGYTALQFDSRHYFHMEFLVWWCVGFAMHTAYTLVLKYVRRTSGTTVQTALPSFRKMLQRTGILAGVIVGICVGPIAVARAWQYRTVGDMYRQFAEAPLEPLQAKGDSYYGTLIQVEERPAEPSFFDPDSPVWFDGRESYLVLDIKGKGEIVPIVAKYETPQIDSEDKLTIRIRVPAGAPGPTESITRCFFPIFNVKTHDARAVRFKGFIFTDDGVRHVAGLHRVRGDWAYPLRPLYVQLPDWQQQPRFQAAARPRLPYLKRLRDARRDNLLTEGGFNQSPIGIPTVNSTLTSETGIVEEGVMALRQTWARKPDTAVDEFISLPVFLEPNRMYEVFFQYNNLSNNVYILRAVQILPDGTTRRLSSYEHGLATPGYGFSRSSFRFVTPQAEESVPVALATEFVAGESVPGEIVWDDVRLVPYEPAPPYNREARFPTFHY